MIVWQERPLVGWEGNTRGGDVVCWYCTGEACAVCSPLSWDESTWCYCDVSERHGAEPCIDPEFRQVVV